MGGSDPSRLQGSPSSRPVSLSSGSAAARAPPPLCRPHVHPRGSRFLRKRHTCESLVWGLWGWSGNAAEDATVPLFQNTAGFWECDPEKALTRHGHRCCLTGKHPCLPPSPPQTLATVPAPTHSHVKVIIFKIAFSRQQPAWSAHPREPWPAPQQGCCPARGSCEPRIAGTSGSLCVWHRQGVNIFPYLHVVPISWQ